MNVLAVPLVVVGSFLAAYALASVLVAILDALGLVYSATREANREESRDAASVPVPRVARSAHTPPRSASGPLGRRVAAYESQL